ncbi:hypothetical protein DH2020_013976 [Rehmannia glutinosa]|uniref:Pentatricopeptide repeat-containing protein n=1 Tax=Rehmannia glutinosa TaxID=99300 RepID=A0ABR0WVL5_REHGL
MWALRRASIQLKNRGLSSGTTRIFCVKSEIERCYLENYNSGIVESQRGLLDGIVYSARSYNTSSSSSNSYMEVCTFSSDAGAKSREQDDDLEDAFSELESPHDVVPKAASGDEIDDDSTSESDLSEGETAVDIQNELETIDTETDAGEKISPKRMPTSAMTKAILDAPNLPVSKVLDKWVEAGNEVTRTEVSITILNLRKRRMFFKALQLSEWLESTERLEFSESNYASRVDLIAKVRGISKAEEYIRKLPESFRGEIVYRTLLANSVAATNVKKSEDLFNKMKKLFPVTSFSCNQLLLLYKRTDKTKIADVLLMMEKENVKPSQFTYQILIGVQGQSNNISGMEQIVETMKSEGMEPNTKIHVTLARSYAAAGLKDKSEAILKEMEGGDIVKNRWACRFLLPVYASLEKVDEVERIWKACESNPRLEECLAAIEAFGQLKRIEDAESAFDKMVKKSKKPSSKHFAALIKIYANNKMLAKGKDLVKQMSESGCRIGPLTWDALVKLYTGAGEVEKADSILEKALKQKTENRFLRDIHNAEKIFLKMRQAGYASRIRPYRSLLYAYINAKAPAYGFTDRMKGDNVIPNKALAGLLARADAFKKSPVAELLE